MGFGWDFLTGPEAPRRGSFSGVSWVGAALGLSWLRGRYVWYASGGLAPTAKEGRGSTKAPHPTPTWAGQDHFQGKRPKDLWPVWSGVWPWHPREESVR